MKILELIAVALGVEILLQLNGKSFTTIISELFKQKIPTDINVVNIAGNPYPLLDVRSVRREHLELPHTPQSNNNEVMPIYNRPTTVNPPLSTNAHPFQRMVPRIGSGMNSHQR